MKKILIFLTVVLLVNLYACSRDCGTSVYGTIVDVNNNPVEGVKVLLKYDGKEDVDYSDETGYYSVSFRHGCSDNNPDKGDLSVSKEGYIEQWIEIKGDDISTVDIVFELNSK